MKCNTPEQHLAEALGHQPGSTLWLADENALGLKLPVPVACTVTNRFDVHQQINSPNNIFNDWDLTPAFAGANFTQVVYRVSKERPVVHHLLNQLAEHHAQWQQLILIGQKNEGLKSYADLAGKRFGNKQVKKHGNYYVACIQSRAPDGAPLESQNYPELRVTQHWGEQPLYSKPGTFGWQKIDDGSVFLIEQLQLLAEELAPRTHRVLDLGCGYGFITLAARTLLNTPATQWLGTDNCAAALSAYARNCGDFAEGFTGDRGLDNQQHPLRPAVDLVLCNPPFHQGFSPEANITQRFVAAMHQWLTPKGTALVVVNQFVGLEKHAQGLFSKVAEVAKNGSFRVIRLTK
ncbi:methyltransferase [Simiduia sp. 21SJ11W-1]|uniref:class I SAM-dependent methyltransferase n=1 Tax=Simiduia sp. 21SJ11W-1 TaxID=2909669 RepID=UPI0020A06EA3|nr:methyltransferase [Simiduia sp. 21SJ11W-1]UTA49332.1 methyltransferase [Simiduia sp. 21SJ11W-1]